MKDNSKILEGLKVLDLSSVLAGPQTGSFFAELGAQVIKVENKLTGGDVTRQWKLASENSEDPYSSYYWSANFGKDVFLLDLTQASDRQRVEDWLASSDILISNYQKRTAEKLGLCPYHLNQKYPELIIAQLSAYDYDDPRAGYDMVMQAETGWLSMTGTDENNLAKLPVALIDIIAAHQLKEALLLAMLQKAKTNKGCVAFVSLYRSAISALANQATNYLMAGHIAKPLGTLHPNIAPYGDIFLTQDNKKIMLAIGSDSQFEKLCKVLKINQTLYEKFSTNKCRIQQRNTLFDTLSLAIQKYSSENISNDLKLNNIPYCFIKTLKDVLDNPELENILNIYDFDDVKRISVKTIAFHYSQ